MTLACRVPGASGGFLSIQRSQPVRSLRCALPLPQANSLRRSVKASTAMTMPQTEQAEDASNLLSQQYSRAMKDAMGWQDRPYDYDYSRGLYYHEVLPGLYCGSQPRHAHDIEELQRDLGISTIISLQQDKDMHYWNVNPEEIRHRCATNGINLVRRPVKDFDPHSLRKILPSAVRALQNAHGTGERVYVHCTAGLGRAPGVIIAYLYWFHNMDLNQAYNTVTSIRPCGPKKEAIRGATFDLVTGQPMHYLDHLPGHAYDGLSEHERWTVHKHVHQS